ncbi:hypothetical protein K438DRAFT_1777159 [Mycena galopus ATCC 62051]|nr:hypothetical protein K438DRAFT_1777159 [Mycena galopus ATCC 62051]
MHSGLTFMGDRVRYNEVQGPNTSWMREDSMFIRSSRNQPSASEGLVWMARRPAAALWARPCPDMLSAYFDLEMMVGGISQPSPTPVLLIETQNHNEGKLLKEGIADKSVFRCTLTVNGKSGMPHKEDLEDRQSIFAGWLGRSNENIQGSGWSKRETRRLTRLPLERQNIL